MAYGKKIIQLYFLIVLDERRERNLFAPTTQFIQIEWNKLKKLVTGRDKNWESHITEMETD